MVTSWLATQPQLLNQVQSYWSHVQHSTHSQITAASDQPCLFCTLGAFVQHLIIPFLAAYFAMMTFASQVLINMVHACLINYCFDITNFTSLLASLIASLLKCSLGDPTGFRSNSFKVDFKYFSNTTCSQQLQKMIVGKILWLPSQLQRFTPGMICLVWYMHN